MSHEVNNSIGAVNSILDSTLNYKDQLTDEDRSDFENATRVAVERNRRLSKFMSNFADVVRIPGPRKELYDLHDLLRSVQVLMESECRRRNIEWHLEPAESTMMVDIDVQQMEQVLVNVVKNAIEAIDGDGTITIQTDNSDTKTLRIIDSGSGIDPEHRQHLFTPFYSTKRDGQGIGLTLIREILINHNFRFHLETVAPGRTVFQIEFEPAGPIIDD